VRGPFFSYHGLPINAPPEPAPAAIENDGGVLRVITWLTANSFFFPSSCGERPKAQDGAYGMQPFRLKSERIFFFSHLPAPALIPRPMQ